MPASVEVDVGAVVTVVATFAEAPDTVAAEYRIGTGGPVVVSLSPDVPTDGSQPKVYRAEVPCDTPGRYYVRVMGTGGRAAARETTFSVRRSHFA